MRASMQWETMNLRLDDGTGRDFDRALRAADVPQASPMTVVTKLGATTKGKTGVLIAFDVELDGKRVTVQATTSAWLLIVAARAIEARG